MAATTYARDRETARTVAGVRVDPYHWASVNVHAMKTWVGDSEIETWCSLRVDVANGGAQTTDLINCSGCATASWRAFKGVS